MTSRTRNILSGATALVGLIGLCWMVFIFGEIPTWVERMDRLYVDMPDAGGLASGSRVTFNGIDCGYVEAVRHHEDPRRGVEIACRIEPDTRIATTATARVESGVLGGSAVLAIEIDRTADKQKLESFSPGDRIKGTSSTLASRLEERLDEGLRRFDELSVRIGRLADEYVAVGRKVNDLLAERRVADVDAGRAAPNLRTMIARADADLAELRKTIDHLNAIVGDPQFREDVAATVHNARQLTDEARASLDRLTTRYVAVADELTKTLQRMNGLLVAVREGEGTMGKMVNDPALYNSLQDAADRLNDALKEFQLLIRKWKAEGVPVRF